MSEEKTGIWLELLTDPDMLIMFARRICHSITQAVHRYAKANNKYMGNPERESSFLQYLDVNSLYDWVMIKSFQLEDLIGLIR